MSVPRPPSSRPSMQTHQPPLASAQDQHEHPQAPHLALVADVTVDQLAQRVALSLELALGGTRGHLGAPGALQPRLRLLREVKTAAGGWGANNTGAKTHEPRIPERRDVWGLHSPRRCARWHGTPRHVACKSLVTNNCIAQNTCTPSMAAPPLYYMLASPGQHGRGYVYRSRAAPPLPLLPPATMVELWLR